MQRFSFFLSLFLSVALGSCSLKPSPTDDQEMLQVQVVNKVLHLKRQDSKPDKKGEKDPDLPKNQQSSQSQTDNDCAFFYFLWAGACPVVCFGVSVTLL